MAHTFENLYLPSEEAFNSNDSAMDFTVFSGADFTAINTTVAAQASTGTYTVSPSELIKDSMAMSAPSSAAFPPLSTPGSGYLESPYMASSSLDTSPMMEGALDHTLNYADFSSAPLFPTDGSDLFAHTGPFKSNVSFTSDPTTFSNQPNASPMVRQKSSPGRPPSTPSTHARKLSGVSGVRKVRKSLGPIVVQDDDDKETAKRKKNTQAARKSRQRKQETQEAMESEIQRLRGIIERMGGDPDEELMS